LQKAYRFGASKAMVSLKIV